MPQLTLEILEKLFAHCNETYFDGQLPMPKLKLSRAKTRLGQMACKRRGGFRLTGWSPKAHKYYDFSISISTYYSLSNDELEDVMIHEMIHYSIAYTGLEDSSPHGKIFRGLMETINKRFGRHVSVTCSTRRLQPRITPKPKKRLALIFELENEGYFLSVVNPRYAGEIELKMQSLKSVKCRTWLETCDERLTGYPQVRSLRARKISRENYLEWLDKAISKG